MGDRANVVVYDHIPDGDPKEAVFLYTHWLGEELPGILRRALRSPDGVARATDGAYLARIIFNEMAEAGSGITTRLTDNQHPLLVVDVCRQVVVEYPEDVYRRVGFVELVNHPGVPFSSYRGRWRASR